MNQTGDFLAARAVGHVRRARSWRQRDGLFRFLFVLLQVAFLGTTILVVPAGVALAANPSADLDQCANGPAPSSPTNGCNPDQWVNGNLGASKSIYREGDSIPYRMRFDNLSLGSHDVIIEWDTTKAGKHAIDYLTTWNRTVADADPCVGVSGCGASTTFPIPADPQVTGAGVTPIAGNFTLFGGTVTAVSAYSYPDGSGFSGDKSARITITFTADVANPVLAWGGHIAIRSDWGNNGSAVAIPGSPYHMRLIDLDGAGGNQDRSLSEDAVIFPGSITIKKQATPEGSTSFSFAAGPGPLSNFNLVDDGTSANTQVFSGITSFQAYTVTESLPSGWQLDNRACQVTSANGGSQNTSSPANGITINLKEGENVTCTFSNSEIPNPSLNVTKDAAESSVDAAGDVIHYTIVVSNTGNTALTGVSVNDPLLANEDCDGVAGAPFVNTGLSIPKGGSLTCTGTYTVTQADIDNNGGGDGDIDNTVTADSNETPPDTASEEVPIVQNPSLNVIKDAAESSVDAAGDVIHYTIVVTNTGNVTLTGVSIDDPLLGNEDCDGVAGAPFVKSGFTLDPGAQLSCTGTYMVSQADLDDNGGGDGDIDNTVTADSNETGPDTASEVVPIVYGPALNVVKTVTSVDGDNLAPFVADEAGDLITYSIVVYNTGNVTLTGVSVDDPLLSNEDCDGVAGAPYVTAGFTLNVGGSVSCTGSYTVTQADLDDNGGGDGDIDNVVTADSNETGPDTDDASVPLLQSPSLSITKDATETGFDSTGDVIHYTIVVTNTGNVTLHNVDVTDAQVGNLVCTPAEPAADLAPGASISCTGSHTISQPDLDAGSFYNQACVDDGAGGATGKCDDVTTPGSQSPALSIDKVATESGFSAAGQVIHYTITVTNTGNVTLHNVDVTDAQVGNLVCTPAEPVADLAPGAQISCTASHTIVQADVDEGSFYNQACVNDGAGGAAGRCDDVTTPGSKNPHLSIDKVDNTGGFDSVDDVISYTITATNDGNVTLHNVDVTDPNVSNLVCAPVDPVADLAPGESIVCTASHTVTQADLDAGHFANQACVDDGQGNAAEACDDVDTQGDQNPELSITKVATEDGFSAIDDLIHYTITAKNIGNVTLHNVDVTDSQVADLDCTPDEPVANLAPNELIVCTASHTITQEDLDAGSFYNQACVDDSGGPAAEVCDDVTTEGEQNPALEIEKIATEQSYNEIGDVIHYTITATNSGNVTLHGVEVIDPNVGDLLCTPDNPAADLAPGDSIVCTATHTITQDDLDAGSVFNEACVDDSDGPAAEACDDVTTEGEQNPELDILKEVAEAKFTDVNQVLHYMITATNIGNVTLHQVVVTDAQVTDLQCTPVTPVDLAPGEKITCTASQTTTQADLDAGFVFNQACVDDNDGAAESGADEACDDVTTPGQQVQDFTNPPTQPNTATVERGRESSPAGGSWLLILGLAIALGAFVMATPQRGRKRG
jgi:uncharacterized repeat protein (TIGR01451 family)